eukprot:GEMP01056321.1.p1 GENE.GEMP01056321.1~~GEMP01056321.1.p1  ORF type:complete len:355 (+),score=56.62 GEMP01056321.1:91-1155(+)
MWVYYIPFIGGCCAPTWNPEASIFRPVSNEYSLLCGPLIFRAFQFFELNAACFTIGSLGFHQLTGPNMRTVVVSAAVISSVYALFLLFAATNVGSSDLGTTRSWYVARASTLSHNVTIYANFHHYIIDYDADYWPPTFAVHHPDVAKTLPQIGTQVRRWTDANCTHWFESDPFGPDKENDEVTYPVFCEVAHSVGRGAYSVIVVAILLALPTIAVMLQRGTMFGDLNCVKFHGVLASFVNILLICLVLRALYNFKVGMPYALQNTIDDSLNGDVLYWETGPVQWMFGTLVVLRLIELVAHYILRTPCYRHSPSPKPRSLTQYMMGPGALLNGTTDAPTQQFLPPMKDDGWFTQP